MRSKEEYDIRRRKSSRPLPLSSPGSLIGREVRAINSASSHAFPSSKSSQVLFRSFQAQIKGMI